MDSKPSSLSSSLAVSAESASREPPAVLAKIANVTITMNAGAEAHHAVEAGDAADLLPEMRLACMLGIPKCK